MKIRIKPKLIGESFKWFTYHQNNSGGIFIKNENLSEYVIIHARSGKDADCLATLIGIDFYDHNEFSGDRWHTQAYNDGTNVPMIYDMVITESFVPTDSFMKAKDITIYPHGSI